MNGPVKNVRQVSPSVEIQKLSFSKVLPQLKSCVREMEDAACNIRASLQTFPSGSLRVSPHRGSYQYFHVTEGSKRNGSKGSYIPMEQIGVARGLAQKAYNEEMASALAEGASVLKSALQKFNSSRIDTCYEMQGPVRRALVAPVYLPNDVYADRWQKVEYQGKEFLEDDTLLTTAKGDRVRSKSEVIIANMLNQMNVPYRIDNEPAGQPCARWLCPWCQSDLYNGEWDAALEFEKHRAAGARFFAVGVAWTRVGEGRWR